MQALRQGPPQGDKRARRRGDPRHADRRADPPQRHRSERDSPERLRLRRDGARGECDGRVLPVDRPGRDAPAARGVSVGGNRDDRRASALKARRAPLARSALALQRKHEFGA